MNQYLVGNANFYIGGCSEKYQAFEIVKKAEQAVTFDTEQAARDFMHSFVRMCILTGITVRGGLTIHKVQVKYAIYCPTLQNNITGINISGNGQTSFRADTNEKEVLFNERKQAELIAEMHKGLQVKFYYQFTLPF